MIAGTTPIIHGDTRASLGERFLKFEMSKDIGLTATDLIKAAIKNSGNENKMRAELIEATMKYCVNRINKDKLKNVLIGVLIN